MVTHFFPYWNENRLLWSNYTLRETFIFLRNVNVTIKQFDLLLKLIFSHKSNSKNLNKSSFQSEPSINHNIQLQKTTKWLNIRFILYYINLQDTFLHFILYQARQHCLKKKCDSSCFMDEEFLCPISNRVQWEFTDGRWRYPRYSSVTWCTRREDDSSLWRRHANSLQASVVLGHVEYLHFFHI